MEKNKSHSSKNTITNSASYSTKTGSMAIPHHVQSTTWDFPCVDITIVTITITLAISMALGKQGSSSPFIFHWLANKIINIIANQWNMQIIYLALLDKPSTCPHIVSISYTNKLDLPVTNSRNSCVFSAPSIDAAAQETQDTGHCLSHKYFREYSLLQGLL